IGNGALEFAGDVGTFLANYTLGPLETLWNNSLAGQLYAAYEDQIGDGFNEATQAITNAIENYGSNVADAAKTIGKGVKKAGKKLRKAFNGPIAGGIVFLDTNGNLILDADEPSTLTDNYGRFDLNYDLATYDTNGDGLLDITEALVIGVGGIETTTGQVFDSSFLAPVGSEITPLTTLKTGLVLNGFTPEDAEQLIKDSYGIEIGDASLDNFDLYAALGSQDGDQTALLDMAEGNVLAHLLLLFGSQVIRLYSPELTGLQAEMALLQVVANVAANTGTIAPESYDFNRQLVAQLATPPLGSNLVNNIPGSIANRPLVPDSILDQVAQFLTASKGTFEETLGGVIASDQVIEDLFLVLPTFNYVKGLVLEQSPGIIKDMIQGKLNFREATAKFQELLLTNNYLLEYELNSDRVISVRSEGTLLEGDTSFHNGQFIVELGEPAPAQGLTLFYNLFGSATHHEDYNLVNGSEEGILRIAPYASSGVIDLELLDDDLAEGIETITLNLQYASDGFTLAPEASSAFLVVTDDENPNPIGGINPTQVITGTINNDELFGGPDSDWIKGSYGNDLLQGDTGSDRLDAGFGADELYGGDGNDALSGHFGDDQLFGEAGNDTLRGGTEADWLYGGDGSDLLLGQSGDDNLYGQSGNDQLEGGAGNDYLSGGANNDLLQGGFGNDILLGDTGDDLITGNAGADQFVINNVSGDFDIFTDFKPGEGDRIVILDTAIDNFDPAGLTFANGFLQYNDQNLALVQNEGNIYALLPLNQVVDVVSELTFPETAPVGSNSLTTGDLPSLDSLTNNTVDPANVEGLLAEILTRGTLRAAITTETPDWQKLQTQALAAALFGDASAVEFVTLSEGEILDAVANQSVDLSAHLFAQTTDPNIDFAPATVYRSDLIVVRPDAGITEPQDLNGATIGVVIDTNARQNLGNVLGSAGISYNLAEFATQAELLNAYDQGTVGAIVLDNLNLNQRPADSTILNLELSVEPLALALPENESAWADVVRWVVQVPAVAESLGITSLNLESLVTSSDPAIQRFLGLTGNLGQSLGIANNFAAQVIRTQGNFEEYWQTAFGETLRHRNHLAANDGLLYSLPFSGSAEPNLDVPENNDRNVLADILERGTVKVGIISDNPGFSVQDETGNYSGFDVDLGRAIAAALFNDPTAVEWVEQDKLQRFTNVASGVVDISAS
ncbi:MAG: transporter substrate-binding domain-containing protein, partial [Prochlorotrichaceae cyanobacterium]